MVKIKTEVFDRVSGYYRPISQFNKGKREEQAERKRSFISNDKTMEDNNDRTKRD